MDNDDLIKLQKIKCNLKKIDSKVKLLILLAKAKQAYDDNKQEKCLSLCKQILHKEPNNPSALRGMGCVMQSQGNMTKAEEYYSKALNFSKNKEIEYTLLGTLYYNNHEFEKAIEHYNMAIEINDNYDLAYEGKNQAMLENHIQILDLQDDLIKRNLF